MDVNSGSDHHHHHHQQQQQHPGYSEFRPSQPHYPIVMGDAGDGDGDGAEEGRSLLLPQQQQPLRQQPLRQQPLRQQPLRQQPLRQQQQQQPLQQRQVPYHPTYTYPHGGVVHHQQQQQQQLHPSAAPQHSRMMTLYPHPHPHHYQQHYQQHQQHYQQHHPQQHYQQHQQHHPQQQVYQQNVRQCGQNVDEWTKGLSIATIVLGVLGLVWHGPLGLSLRVAGGVGGLIALRKRKTFVFGVFLALLLANAIASTSMIATGTFSTRKSASPGYDGSCRLVTTIVFHFFAALFHMAMATVEFATFGVGVASLRKLGREKRERKKMRSEQMQRMVRELQELRQKQQQQQQQEDGVVEAAEEVEEDGVEEAREEEQQQQNHDHHHHHQPNYPPQQQQQQQGAHLPPPPPPAAAAASLPPAVVVNPFGRFVNELHLLNEMGFSDDNANAALLVKHNGNIQSVVAEYINRPRQ